MYFAKGPFNEAEMQVQKVIGIIHYALVQLGCRVASRLIAHVQVCNLRGGESSCFIFCGPSLERMSAGYLESYCNHVFSSHNFPEADRDPDYVCLTVTKPVNSVYLGCLKCIQALASEVILVRDVPSTGHAS